MNRWMLGLALGLVGLMARALPAGAQPTPDPPLRETVLSVDASAGAGATAKVVFDAVARREAAANLRGMAVRISEDGLRKIFVDSSASNYPWIHVQTVTWSNPAGQGDFTIHIEGEGTLPWRSSGGGRLLPIDDSDFGKPKPLVHAAGQDANAGFAIDYPFYDRAIVRLKLPGGGKGYATSGADVALTANGQEFRRTTRIEDGVVVMSRSTRSLEQQVAASQAALDNPKLSQLEVGPAFVRAP